MKEAWDKKAMDYHERITNQMEAISPDISLSSCKQKIEWLVEMNKELLEACKAMYDELSTWYDGMDREDKETTAALEMGIEAISKAEGNL